MPLTLVKVIAQGHSTRQAAIMIVCFPMGITLRNKKETLLKSRKAAIIKAAHRSRINIKAHSQTPSKINPIQEN